MQRSSARSWAVSYTHLDVYKRQCQSRGALQSIALEIGERLAGQQSSNSCSVGPCFFISKAYAKAYGVKAKEAQLVKGVGVSAKKLEDGTYCFVLTLDMLF